MTNPHQKIDKSKPVPNVDFRKFDDVRGIINVAENRGDAIAYRGYNPPPNNSGGNRKLYGQILKALNDGNAIGFDQIQLHEGEAQAIGEGSSQTPVVALDSRSSRAIHGQTSSTGFQPIPQELMAEYLGLPGITQDFLKFLGTKNQDPARKDASRSSKKVPEDSR